MESTWYSPATHWPTLKPPQKHTMNATNHVWLKFLALKQFVWIASKCVKVMCAKTLLSLILEQFAQYLINQHYTAQKKGRSQRQIMKRISSSKKAATKTFKTGKACSFKTCHTTAAVAGGQGARLFIGGKLAAVLAKGVWLKPNASGQANYSSTVWGHK